MADNGIDYLSILHTMLQPHQSVLLRRHLCKRLSDYFGQPSNYVVGSISHIPSGLRDAGELSFFRHPIKTRDTSAINFKALLGEWQWKQTYKRVYEEQKGMWLTPCELFTPYYSNILANFVSTSIKASLSSDNDTFEIVELGGGRGTNANALLNYLKEKHMPIYERLESYTIYDTSPTLHELQREVTSIHAYKMRLVNSDLIDIAEGSSPFLSQSNKPTVVIALELLDNLPHDKIARCIQSREIMQAEVIPFEGLYQDSSSTCTQQLHYSEVFHPLNDNLLQNILCKAPGLYSPKLSQGPIWIPSVACGVLMKLYECRPNTSIALADFDWLPPPDIDNLLSPARAEPTAGDPLVTDMNGKDHACYLSSPPNALCDILFPTDFKRLAAFVNHIHSAKSNHSTFSVTSMKQSEFLLKHGMQEIQQTKSWLTGYSPLIDDFGNCSVLEVMTQQNAKI